MDPVQDLSALPPSPYPASGLFGALPVVTVGPKAARDPDYQEAEQPDEKTVLADIEDLLEEHNERLLQTEAMHRALAPRRDDMDVGHFENDEEDIEAGEIEVFPLNTLRDEHEFNNGVIAAMDPYIEHTSRERIDAEEILAIEDGCYYALECFARQYGRQNATPLRRAFPNMLQRCGALVSLLTVNPDDEKCGAAYSLIDPMTVFPIWEGAHGLSEVARVYQDTTGNVIGNFSRRGDAAFARTVEKIASESSVRGKAERNRLVEVKEYWNRDWLSVLVDDEEVLTRRHGLARVPFIITLGGFELPLGMHSGQRTYWNEGTAEPGWRRAEETSPDVAAQWRPWAYRYLMTHAIQEAVAGRTLTEFARSMFRPMIYEFDPLNRNQDTAELSQYARAINKIPLGNKLSVLPTAPDAPTVAMLDQFLQANANQGLWSQIRAGNIPPQTPSAALGTMFDLGGADRGALTDAIAMHTRDLLEWWLELVRDWGPAMGIAGQKGALTVPNREAQYASPTHRLTPEMIERAGCYLNVSLFHWKPDPALAQYLATMLSSGMSSPETAIRKSRYVPDPMREIQRIEDAMLRQTPEIATQYKIKQLNEEIQMALAEGDDESADYAMVAAMQLEWNAEMQMMAGSAPANGSSGGGGMGAGMPSPGGMAGPGSVGAPISQQGLSMPELGMGTGSNGGRPMGTTQPKGGMRNTTVTAPQR